MDNSKIEFAKKRHLAWPHNCLRHSFATYRLAAVADTPRVALEMGNSPQKLMTNYRELADEHDAAAWFAINAEVDEKRPILRRSGELAFRSSSRYLRDCLPSFGFRILVNDDVNGEP